MKIEISLDSKQTMLSRRGLDGRVQQFFTAECARCMDPYVPMQQGMLKNKREIGPNYVQYNSPYAHFHFIGLLMLGVKSGGAWAKSGEPKRYASPPKEMQYHGAPKRGPHWEKRMWVDKGHQIMRKTAAMVGGTAK